jgi:hypothetical protein
VRRFLVLVATFCVVLVSCGEGAEETAPGEDVDAFVGSTSCVMTPKSDQTTADETREIREHFSCTIESSDKRVAGTQEIDTVTVIPEATASIPESLMWWAEEDIITTEGGIWRVADGFGVVDMVGVHPMAERVTPFNYGVSKYIGEGGYSGLELTIIYSGTNQSGGYAGWIEQG